MTISSPVGTVTTFQFDPSGTIEDWTVPFHDGPMEVAFFGIYAGDIGAHPNFSTFKALVASMYGLSVA